MRTDGQTNMKELIVPFRNVVNAPKNGTYGPVLNIGN